MPRSSAGCHNATTFQYLFIEIVRAIKRRSLYRQNEYFVPAASFVCCVCFVPNAVHHNNLFLHLSGSHVADKYLFAHCVFRRWLQMVNVNGNPEWRWRHTNNDTRQQHIVSIEHTCMWWLHAYSIHVELLTNGSIFIFIFVLFHSFSSALSRRVSQFRDEEDARPPSRNPWHF